MTKRFLIDGSRLEDYRKYLVQETGPDGTRQAKYYPRGSFIYMLGSRERANSASYYTPEVLTRCLVTFALDEALKPLAEAGKGADALLDLTICEPAMGSGAFLCEAVAQLADRYLALRAQERGEALEPSAYEAERRRVMAFLARNNCYGVDLNPTARELGAVSLWLESLSPGSKAPWFDLRLRFMF